MKHTKGPWTLETVPTQIGICHKIGPFPSDGVYDRTYACVYSNNTRMSDLGYSAVGDELLANARLIASAPEMLDLLVEFVREEYVDRDFLIEFKASAKRLIAKITEEASE